MEENHILGGGFISILFPIKCTVLTEITTLVHFLKKMAATAGRTITKRVHFIIDIIYFYSCLAVYRVKCKKQMLAMGHLEVKVIEGYGLC